MARRADPKRLAEARRAGHRSRLIAEARLSEEKADHWLAAWEAEGRRRGLDEGMPEFWTPAWVWIAARRRGTVGRSVSSRETSGG